MLQLNLAYGFTCVSSEEKVEAHFDLQRHSVPEAFHCEPCYPKIGKWVRPNYKGISKLCAKAYLNLTEKGSCIFSLTSMTKSNLILL